MALVQCKLVAINTITLRHSNKVSKAITKLLDLPAPIGTAVYQMLVIQAFRPDRLLAMTHRVVGTILGEAFMHAAEQELNLASVVETEVCARRST